MDLPKAKRLRVATRQWHPVEVTNIIEYISEGEKQGFEFEKPSAVKYYSRLINTLQLSSVSVSQIQNKMKNLKNKLMKAYKWQGESGQGVDRGTIDAHLEVMCPNYYTRLSIYCTKNNFIIPYQHDSLDPSGDKINVNQDGQEINDANLGDEDSTETVALTEAIHDNDNVQNGESYAELVEGAIVTFDDGTNVLENSTEMIDDVEPAASFVPCSIPLPASQIADKLPVTSKIINVVSRKIIAPPIATSIVSVPATSVLASTSTQSSFAITSVASKEKSVANSPEVARLRRSLSTLPESLNGFKAKEQPPNAATVISQALAKRADAILEKIKHDTEWKKEQLELEKEMRMQEFELKREEIKSKERLELAEIQMTLEMGRRGHQRED